MCNDDCTTLICYFLRFSMANNWVKIHVFWAWKIKLLNSMTFHVFNDPQKPCITVNNIDIDQTPVHSVPIVVPAGILELGSSLSFSGHSNTSLLGNLMN